MEEIDYNKVLGTNVRRLREERNLTQADLCDICNIERANMSRIENGHVNVKLSTLVSISIALRVDPHELLRVD